MRTFLALFDLHFGFERKSGHKVSLHDPSAMSVALQFASDFKPDELILGGDMLDCGAISHHNRKKPGRTEGLRVMSDAGGLSVEVIKPLQQLKGKLTYIVGNHEDWLNDLEEREPGLGGMLDIRNLLGLQRWNLIPQGGYYDLGKLRFAHGDQFKGGEQIAKTAVIAAERSIRFGHFHTFQTYTKTSFFDVKLGRTGVAVPCLCKKDPKYGEGAPNRWVQGFNWGYIHSDGTFSDYVTIITAGKAVANGKLYRG